MDSPLPSRHLPRPTIACGPPSPSPPRTTSERLVRPTADEPSARLIGMAEGGSRPTPLEAGPADHGVEVGRADSLSQGRPTLASMEALGVAVPLDGLICALEASWSAETSASSDWSTSLPARGHCAVSALIVQDRLGGDLLRAVVCGESHYWNRLPDGTEIDLTRGQFGLFDPIEVTVGSRDYVLSFAGTRRRYELLRQRVSRELHDD